MTSIFADGTYQQLGFGRLVRSGYRGEYLEDKSETTFMPGRRWIALGKRIAVVSVIYTGDSPIF